MGTQLFDSLIAQKHLSLDGEDLKLTGSSATFASDPDIDVEALRKAWTPL